MYVFKLTYIEQMYTLAVSRSLIPLRADARSIPDGFEGGCEAIGAAGGGGGGGGGGADAGGIALVGAERPMLELLVVAELFSMLVDDVVTKSDFDMDGG